MPEMNEPNEMQVIATRIEKKNSEDRVAGYGLAAFGVVWTVGVAILLWLGFFWLLARVHIDYPSAIALGTSIAMIVLLFLYRPREKGSLATLYDSRRLAYSGRITPTGSGAAMSAVTTSAVTGSLVTGMMVGAAVRSNHNYRTGTYWFLGSALIEVIAGGLRMVREGIRHLVDARQRKQPWVTDNAVRVYNRIAQEGDAGMQVDQFDAWVGDDPHKLAGIVALDDIGLLGKRTNDGPPVMLARSLTKEATRWDDEQ